MEDLSVDYVIVSDSDINQNEIELDHARIDNICLIKMIIKWFSNFLTKT